MERLLNAVRIEERARISQELHDDFGQLLTILKMDLCDLQKQMPLGSLLINNKIEEMKISVDQLMIKVRTIASEMRPSVLEKFGLEEGIRSLVGNLRVRTNKTIQLQILLDGYVVDQEVATGLFKILQEALTNSFRHSHSDRIDIRLLKTEKGVTLLVKDFREFNGSNDANNIEAISFLESKNSFGLIGMRDRVKTLKGDFSVWNDGGIVVRAYIPDRVLL